MEILQAAAGVFLAKVFEKGVVDPIAQRVGRKAVDRLIGPCCDLLDEVCELAGLDFDPEQVLTEYLQGEEISDKEFERLLEEVFKRWDLRVACSKRSER